MLRLLLLAGTFTVLACAAGEAPLSALPPAVSSTPTHPPTKMPRYALIWGNAFVFTAPTDTAQKARMRSYPDNARDGHSGDVWPVEIVGEQGSWVTVRTLGGADAEHCFRGPSMLNAFSVVLHVARVDLAPVVQTSVVGSFDDASWVAIHAGVAVSVVARHAFADGLRLPLPMAAGVGSTYGLAKRFDVRGVRQQTRTPVLVNGLELSPGALASVPVWRSEGLGSGALIHVLSGCMQASAKLAQAPQLVPHNPVQARDAASPAAPKSAKHFPIGTRLFFADGRPAGETVDAIAMSLLEKHGDHLCFQRSLSDYTPSEPMPEHHVLALCVAANDAREKAQPRASWPVGTTPPLEPR